MLLNIYSYYYTIIMLLNLLHVIKHIELFLFKHISLYFHNVHMLLVKHILLYLHIFTCYQSNIYCYFSSNLYCCTYKINTCHSQQYYYTTKYYLTWHQGIRDFLLKTLQSVYTFYSFCISKS